MEEILENHRAAAEEIVAIAQLRGVDLEPIRREFAFQKELRYIDFWRKDSSPGSGSVDEALGTLRYLLQGTISRLPGSPPQIPFACQWNETGVLESIELAFELVKAWLLDGKEIDELPRRSVKRSCVLT